MSLLMEALKKAERAKQGQTAPNAERPDGSAETPGSVTAPSPELSLLSLEGAAGRVGMTGNSDSPSVATPSEPPPSIPDLTPLSIADQNTTPTRVEPTVSTLELTLSETPLPRGELASPAPTATPSVEPEVQPQAATSSKSGANIPPAHPVKAPRKTQPQDIRAIAAAQQKAKTVFSAKQPTHNRTLLLTGAAVAIVLGLVGFGVYYWQITSTSTMFLPTSAPQPTSAAAPATPVDAAALLQQPPVASAHNSIDKPILSTAEGPTPASAQANPPSAPAAYEPARTETRSGSEPFKENPAIRIRQSAATSQLNPTLGKAYQSFLAGDTGTAQQLYHKALQQEPNNRDALLGMAAISLKHKQSGQAAAYYGKLLDLDPADPDALAGLIGLQGQSDPAQSESRLKKVLMQNPQADAAHFALGNLYAQQSRWAEAQQSHFRAYSSVPGNADYAFNLAVSLDHLNQGKLALDYYQRALALPGPANFDRPSVQIRIKELLQPAGN